MAKAKTTNGPVGKVKRLSPAQLVPTAKAGTDKDGNFVVVVTTGRQRETLTATDAYVRAGQLDQASKQLAKVAKRVNIANGNDDQAPEFEPEPATTAHDD